MKNVLIVGSIGLDNLKTPYGEKRQNVLGGSISCASIAARIFSPVSIIGVREDFPQEHRFV